MPGYALHRDPVWRERANFVINAPSGLTIKAGIYSIASSHPRVISRSACTLARSTRRFNSL